jgi:hypothetical protein
MSWANKTTEEIKADIKVSFDAMYRQPEIPSIFAFTPVLADAWIKATVKDAYEQARQLFNLRHAL